MKIRKTYVLVELLVVLFIVFVFAGILYYYLYTSKTGKVQIGDLSVNRMMSQPQVEEDLQVDQLDQLTSHIEKTIELTTKARDQIKNEKFNTLASQIIQNQYYDIGQIKEWQSRQPKDQ